MPRNLYPIPAPALREAVRAHTNLNVFNTLVSILEGGNIYGENKARDRIIAICTKEMQRQLNLYDKAVTALQKGNSK